MSEVKIKLGKGHDTKALAKEFKKNNRLKITDLLAADAAEGLLSSLFDDTSWMISYSDGGKIESLTSAEVKALSEDENNKMMLKVYKAAEDGYQAYLYTYPLDKSDPKATKDDLFAYKALDFVNSEPMLKFVREVTGISTLKSATADANWYHRDHFSTLNKDVESDDKKRVAYTINLTKDWLPDWGAILQFHDNDGHVTDGYLPTYNALEIFTVPQDHSISIVAPFVGHPRLSITGWFYDA